MIVKMLHLDLVCLAAEKDKTLTQLRDLGAVHLDLSSAQGATVAAAKGEAADAEKAVRLILKARGKAKDVKEGVVLAAELIDSGKALATLQNFIEFSNRPE